MNLRALLLYLLLLGFMVPAGAGAPAASDQPAAITINPVGPSPVIGYFKGLMPKDDPALQKIWIECLTAIATRNPFIAKQCSGHADLIAWLQHQDANRAGLFIAYTGAIEDMQTNLYAFAESSNWSGLGSYLVSTLERSPYVDLGFGPNPENFLYWAFQLKNSCPKCPTVAASVVLPWEMLGMRTKQNIADVVAKRSRNARLPDLETAKAKWSRLTLKQRNNLLAAYMRPLAAKFIKGKCANTAQEKTELFAYLSFDDASMSRVMDYQEKCDLLDSIKLGKDRTKVPADIQARYGDLPPGRRLAELSGYLKRMGKNDTLLAKKINESRNPIAMTEQDRKKLSGLLAPLLLEQIRTTEVGKEVAGYYDRGELTLKFSIEKQRGSNAYFSPVDRNIVVSSDLLSRYMRTHGYTMQDMLTDKRVRKGFAKFVSPTFLHEAIHHVQNEWLVSHGYPDMYVKDKEGETFLTQSVYMEERMQSDPSFRRMVDLEKKYSAFMSQKFDIKETFLNDADQLRSDVGMMYSTVPNLPGGRASYCLQLVVELNRRYQLPEEQQAALEADGLDYHTAMEKYANSDDPFRYMKTSDLEDMRDNLVSRIAVYEAKEKQVFDGISARREALKNNAQR
ncbi:MAG: hypothetical protein PHW69_07995 [Elusimicrobiaceae bacterium]|nr:hypothetical protein [Elusimicrobiaceae bacterium]